MRDYAGSNSEEKEEKGGEEAKGRRRRVIGKGERRTD
jgi:hypothetical protein